MCLKHKKYLFQYFFKNWDSLRARLNSHYEPWSFFSFFQLGFTPCKAEQSLRDMELQEKKSTKKITGYRKSVYKEPTVKRCLLILDLKPLRS